MFHVFSLTLIIACYDDSALINVKTLIKLCLFCFSFVVIHLPTEHKFQHTKPVAEKTSREEIIFDAFSFLIKNNFLFIFIALLEKMFRGNNFNDINHFSCPCNFIIFIANKCGALSSLTDSDSIPYDFDDKYLREAYRIAICFRFPFNLYWFACSIIM